MTPFREQGALRTLIVTIGGKVIGVMPQTGEVQWQHKISGGGYPTSLMVTETRVFACCPPHLVCLEYPTGAVIWSADVPSSASATLLLDGGLLYVTTMAGELDCYSVDGQHLWHNPLKGMGTGAVALGLPGNVTQAEFWS